MGCIVDTRKYTHEKIVIVDGEILWFGSLNPLSHTSRTGEVMARLVSANLAQQMAAFVAIKPARATETYANLAMVKENPPCALQWAHLLCAEGSPRFLLAVRKPDVRLDRRYRSTTEGAEARRCRRTKLPSMREKDGSPISEIRRFLWPP
jgi:hypothetical protein